MESPRYSPQWCTVKCDLGETGNVQGIFGERYNFEWIAVVHTADVTRLVLGWGCWGGEESS